MPGVVQRRSNVRPRAFAPVKRKSSSIGEASSRRERFGPDRGRAGAAFDVGTSVVIRATASAMTGPPSYRGDAIQASAARSLERRMTPGPALLPDVPAGRPFATKAIRVAQGGPPWPE